MTTDPAFAPPPDVEVELKFPLDDAAAVRPQLDRLSAVAADPIVQQDRYFAHPARDFGRTDEAFRLRSTGEENVITYKGPLLDASTKTRQEIEVPFASGRDSAGRMTALLQSLGFREVRTVTKHRIPYYVRWHDRQFTIELDDVEGLGLFLEIETIARQCDWQQARDSALALASELGLSRSERRSYLALLLEQDQRE